MVAAGDADGTIGGAVYSTPDIIRAALKVIGTAENTKLLSSFFFMLFQDRPDLPSEVNVFTDCGLVIDPTAEELADIAISSAESMHRLTGLQPKVAMLSFSTRGSAQHGNVTKVSKATALVQAARPDLVVDGELQFDAAMMPSVGRCESAGLASGWAGKCFLSFRIWMRATSAIKLRSVLAVPRRSAQSYKAWQDQQMICHAAAPRMISLT
jgi:phosphate acetyltransferase